MTGHLIHIGFPKTGSNFLRAWFAQHPQLDYREGGIAGFANIFEMVRTAALPKSGALYRVTSSEGFATPLRSFGNAVIDYERGAVSLADAQRAACDLLADLFPNAMVVLVTRGFRSSIPSMYSQTVRSGNDVDFAEFCRGLERAVRENADGWDFCRVIALYRARFGSARVIPLPWELLRDDARAFTGVLETRLGLAPFAPKEERLNPALSSAELLWYPRFSRMLRRIGSRRLLGLYGRAAQQSRLRLPAAILQRFSSRAMVMDVPESLVQAYRGRGACLRDEPLYARYASDYLF